MPFIDGTFVHMKTGEFPPRPGERYGRKYVTAQILEKEPNGAASLAEVGLPDDTDPKLYKEGQPIKLQVRVSAKDSRVYLRAVENGEAPAPRAAAKV
jgi:hypothetical protein